MRCSDCGEVFMGSHSSCSKKNIKDLIFTISMEYLDRRDHKPNDQVRSLIGAEIYRCMASLNEILEVRSLRLSVSDLEE